MTEWINVKDQLPEPDEYVLIINICGEQFVGSYQCRNLWVNRCDCVEGTGPGTITHWMPLPKPPNDNEPSILEPGDFYKVFEKHPDECSMFGVFSVEDVDNHVKRVFSPEYWPDRLKEEPPK